MALNIILHRNLLSPFCEKVMLMLGYSGLSWSSVLTTKDTPRSALANLVGTYSRRVPVLQVGADFYCDTATISNKIAELSQNKALSTTYADDEPQALLNTIDMKGNPALLQSLPVRDFLLGYFRHLSFKDAMAFFKDRSQLAKKFPKIKEQRAAQPWKQIARDYIDQLENILSGQGYLYADNEPGATDFAAYTMVWYHYKLNKLRDFKELNATNCWFNDMNKISYGKSTVITSERALKVAESSLPENLPEPFTPVEHYRVQINDPIGIAIENAVSGKLVYQDTHKNILSRKLSSGGEVHLHIPRQCRGACG